MEFDHEFTVPVPVAEAWPVLLDLERVAPCVPGATLDSVSGEEFTGRLRVKVGAMTITYKGTGRIVAADEATHTVTIEGSAKEARGPGTAAATVQAQVVEEDGQSLVRVHTKLNVTGRPAQFGRNLLSEVGARLISRFATALADQLAGPSAEPETAVPEAARAAEEAAPAVDESLGLDAREAHEMPPAWQASSRPTERGEEAIDLLELAGPSVLKRVVPLAAIALLLIFVIRALRRRS